jgi:hypothetical protein
VYVLVKEVPGREPVPVVGSELKRVRKIVEDKLHLSSLSPVDVKRHSQEQVKCA